MASTSKAQSLDLDRILDERIDWRYKSFPEKPATTIRDVRKRGWNLLDGEFMFPTMVLKESALRHNVDEMAALCKRHEISLAPHGKTSMAPQLFQMQLDAGAWAVTAATMWQVRVWRAFGARRVILANELVEPASIRWVAGELQRDPQFDFYCLVDSVPEVRLLEGTLDGTGLERRIPVLLELGLAGGRTGCRTRSEAREVTRAVAASRHLSLAGVEGFEGIIGSPDLGADLVKVDGFLSEIRSLAVELDAAGLFAQVAEVIVTAGGGAFLDRVIADLATPWRLSHPVRTVLRSGCYLTHDAVHYKEVSPFGSRLADTAPLEEALEAWGAVLSLPEPGMALLGFGKRDVPHDLELPVPRLVKRQSVGPRPLKAGASITVMNDQHAYMKIPGGEELAVGDLVGCGVSHPCTAFDKWRLLPVVDDDYNVLDAVLTYFYDRAHSTMALAAAGAFDWAGLADTQFFHVSGITLALSDSSREVARRAMEEAKGSGASVTMDVNYRQRLWGREAAAEAVRDVAPLVDVLVATAEDARDLFGADGVEQLQAALGVETVVLTLGAAGAIASRGGTTVRRGGHAVETIDRMGAGDAYVAWLIWGLVDGSPQLGLEPGLPV